MAACSNGMAEQGSYDFQPPARSLARRTKAVFEGAEDLISGTVSIGIDFLKLREDGHRIPKRNSTL